MTESISEFFACACFALQMKFGGGVITCSIHKRVFLQYLDMYVRVGLFVCMLLCVGIVGSVV